MRRCECASSSPGRRELRDSLVAETTRARAGGATYLGLAGPRSAPLSGSLLVTPVTAPLDEEGRWADELDGEVDRTVVPAGPVVRAIRLRHRSSEDSSLGDDVPTLAVDYWVTAAPGRTVLITCSTPLVAHREAMVGLFDAVIETLTWHDPDVMEQPA